MSTSHRNPHGCRRHHHLRPLSPGRTVPRARTRSKDRLSACQGSLTPIWTTTRLLRRRNWQAQGTVVSTPRCRTAGCRRGLDSFRILGVPRSGAGRLRRSSGTSLMSYSNYCGGAPTTRRPKAIGGSECRFTNRCLQHRTADECNDQGSEIAGAYHKLGGQHQMISRCFGVAFPTLFFFSLFFLLFPFLLFSFGESSKFVLRVYSRLGLIAVSLG